MRNFFYFIVIVLLGTATVASAAPHFFLTRSLIPETDGVYDIGTTSAAYNGYFNDLTIAGTCTGCGGGGSGGSSLVGTSSAETNTYIPWWTTTAAGTALLSGGSTNLTWDGTKLFAAQATTTLLSGTTAWFTSFTGDLTGDVTGNASTATALETARTINGTSFDGTANITVTAASSTLLGDNNTWSGTNTFTNATTSNFAITNLANALLSTNANGSVIATTTIGSNLLDTTGDWTGTLDGYEASTLLAGSFSTTSADYWETAQTRWATTSTDYWLTQQSLTAASSTLLSDANTWSARNIFSNVLNLSATTSALLATDASGNVISTTTIGSNLISGLLGTVNGTSFSRGDSITVTAASSTLLGDNNTWSGLNAFGNASTTLLSTSGQSWFTGLLTAGNASTTQISASGAAYFPGSGIWNASGSVGIGTTSPQAQLHVLSSGVSGKTFSQNNGLIVENSGSSNEWYALQVSTAGANDAFSITNAGNIGIGKTPGERLGIKSAGNSTNPFVVESSGSSNNLAVIEQDSSGDGNLALYDSFGNLGVFLRSDTGNSYMDGGNFGIGTTSPGAKLQVDGDGAQAIFNSATASDARMEFHQAGTRIGLFNWDTAAIRLQADSGNHLDLWAGGAQAVRVQPDGNVGIASSTPQRTLSVDGSVVVQECTLTDGATVTWDTSQCSYARVVLGGNRTLDITNETEAIGQSLRLVACASGGAYSITSWDSAILWPSATAPTQTATDGNCDVFAGFVTTASGTPKVFFSSALAF